jgi:hypothetical protein
MVKLTIVPKPAQPWKPAVATAEIRRIANSEHLTLSYRTECIEQLAHRGIIIGDVLHVLKSGFVYQLPEPTTREQCFKYLVESKTPNSGNRLIRVVAIPDADKCWLKVLSVMWVDERLYVGR